jgi:hypothetical protein
VDGKPHFPEARMCLSTTYKTVLDVRCSRPQHIHIGVRHKELLLKIAPNRKYVCSRTEQTPRPREGFTVVVPKVGCAAPWGALRVKRRQEELEMGPSERHCWPIYDRSGFRPDIGKLVPLHQAQPSH